MNAWTTVSGSCAWTWRGVRVSADSPYPDGSIPLQMPHFAARGLDLLPYYPATLNISIGAVSVFGWSIRVTRCVRSMDRPRSAGRFLVLQPVGRRLPMQHTIA